MFKSFKDYIGDRKVEGVDSTEGLAGNPKVKLVADYDGPDVKKPAKGEGQSDPNPYKSANGNAKTKAAETGGFGDLGDKNLKYDPKTDGGTSKMTALGTEIKGEWPKIGLPKTEQFFNKTKNMSARQFAEYMVKESSSVKLTNDLPMVNADCAGPFHPHPSEVIRYVAALGHKSPKIIEQLIHELKRLNVLGEVFKAALEHPESYHELCQLFGDKDGEKRSQKFARALKETVGPPMGLGDDEDEEDRQMHNHGPEEDDEEGMEDEMGDEEDEEGMEDGDMDDEDEMGDEEDEEGMEDGDEMGNDGEDEMGPSSAFGQKPKMKHAHANIMSSMSKMGLGQ